MKSLPPMLAAVCLAAFLLVLRPLFSLDVWWHGSMGRAVLAEGSRTVPEPVAFVGPPDYVDPEWLFDLLTLAVLTVSGGSGMTLLTAVLASLSALVLFLAAREAGAEDDDALMVTALAVGASAFRFMPRPQAGFLVMLPLAMWLALVVRRREGRARAWASAGLMATLLVWSQSHSSVVVAPVVVGLLLVTPWPGLPALPPRGLALLVPLALTPFLGAFGLGVVDQIGRHANDDATAYITDMQPLTWSMLTPVPVNGQLWLVLLLVLAAHRVVTVRRVPLGAVGLVLLGLALAVTAQRFRAAWALMTLPLVAFGLAQRPAHRWTRRGALALLFLDAIRGLPFTGLGVDPNWVSVELGDALQTLGVRGRLFNEYDAGGYLGWKLAPDVRVSIDGRTPTHFDADDLYGYRRAVRDLEVFHAMERAYGFDALAIRRDRPICEPVVAEGRWVPVWAGQREVVFLPAQAGRDPVEAPCLPAKDPSRREGPRGEARVEAWEEALSRGEHVTVRREAEALLDDLRHDADPRVRWVLARACAADEDVDCVGSQAWRAALHGVPGARELLAEWRDRLSDGPRRRADRLLGP